MKVLFICVNRSHFVQPAEYSEFCFKYGDIVINLALRPLFGFNNFNFSPTQDDKHCTFVLFNRSLIVIRITRESDVWIFHLVSETKENVQFEKTTIHHIEFRRRLSVTEKGIFVPLWKRSPSPKTFSMILAGDAVTLQLEFSRSLICTTIYYKTWSTFRLYFTSTQSTSSVF